MSQPAPISLIPSRDDFETQLAALPESYGVYAIRSHNSLLHLSWSAQLRRRVCRLLNPRRASGQHLAALISHQQACIECWPCGSALEASLTIYSLAAHYHPDEYLKRLRLRFPWFVTLTRDPYPRLAVTNRPSAAPLAAVGPFSSRDAALRYEEAVLSLFQIRRCIEPLQPAPDHPGCIYGEMNLCLRPCQLQVSAIEYASECARAADFLKTAPEAAVNSLSSARDRAADQLDFEYAAQLHKQLERVRLAQAARPEVVADLENFNGIALTPGYRAAELQLRPMLRGCWQEPVSLEVNLEVPHAESLDTRLRHVLAPALNSSPDYSKRWEHMAIFSRWYHSSNRAGEWFPFDLRTGVPYRKIARGLSRMARHSHPAVTSTARAADPKSPP